jgi:hypothetical protein
MIGAFFDLPQFLLDATLKIKIKEENSDNVLHCISVKLLHSMLQKRFIVYTE